MPVVDAYSLRLGRPQALRRWHHHAALAVAAALLRVPLSLHPHDFDGSAGRGATVTSARDAISALPVVPDDGVPSGSAHWRNQPVPRSCAARRRGRISP